MGTLDPNGIWEYDNTDHVVPLATFMNLGQNSVSDAMADLRTDLTPDNDQYDVGISGGPTDDDTIAWRRGGTAGIKVQFAIGSATHNLVLGTLLSKYRPPWTIGVPLSPNSTTPNQCFLTINSAGTITFLMYGSSNPLTTVRGGMAWPST